MREQTMTKLRALKLSGMVKGYEEQITMTATQALSFDDRFGLLVDREENHRLDRRYRSRLKQARLREPAATVEDIDFIPGRGLDRGVVMNLASCAWIRDKQNVIITGPAGVGKTYLACALAHKAMQNGLTARYFRLPRLFHELAQVRVESRYMHFLAQLTKTDVIVIDDFATMSLNGEQRRDFFEVVEDRYGTRSLVMVSQVPVDTWFDTIGDSTIADGILVWTCTLR